MSKQQEALRLALEALEPFITPNWAGSGVDEANAAYTALRKALAEQPAQQEPPAWWPAVENILKEYGLQAIDFVADFKAALAEQPAQQKPVNQRAHEMALRQWDHWKQYALELQEKLVKYEGGAPMILNTSTQPAQQQQQEPTVPAAAYDRLFALNEANAARIIELEEALMAQPQQEPVATESVLIDGAAYTVPAPVACEMLRLHLEIKAAPVQHEQMAAAKKDAVFEAAIEFVGTLTGMKPPPIETAPPEIFKPFRDFTEKVCSIFAAPQPAQRKPLTLREIGAVCGNFSNETIKVVRQTEAAHGIKENT